MLGINFTSIYLLKMTLYMIRFGSKVNAPVKTGLDKIEVSSFYCIFQFHLS